MEKASWPPRPEDPAFENQRYEEILAAAYSGLSGNGRFWPKPKLIKSLRSATGLDFKSSDKIVEEYCDRNGIPLPTLPKWFAGYTRCFLVAFFLFLALAVSEAIGVGVLLWDYAHGPTVTLKHEIDALQAIATLTVRLFIGFAVFHLLFTLITFAYTQKSFSRSIRKAMQDDGNSTRKQDES